MHALKKDKFIYIPIPKNGVMTFTGLLENNGWEWFNFYENDLDLNDYFLWGHLTDPNKRHTRGVEQYLRNNPDIDFTNTSIERMLVSAVFDQHGYSVHMILGHLAFLPIYWIPLDASIINWNGSGQVLNGNDLTNDFFNEHDLNLEVTSADIRNESVPSSKKMQEHIRMLKEKYVENYNCLVGNFLDSDIILYNKVVKQFQIKYGSAE
jgi:hypothetical protein